MFKFSIRGQAALEFLTTYGWAVLVILVMIASLSNFGILAPDRFLPERCSTSASFACDEFQIFNDGNFSLVLTNQIGQDVRSMSIGSAQVGSEIYDQGSNLNENVNCSFYSSEGSKLGSGTNIRSGQSIMANCTVPSDMIGSIGGKMSIDLDMSFQRLGARLSNPLAIQLYGTVQEARED